ncbi:MAG TPA: CehA/McbA family metallohydrolase [Anaerolineales bacterium]|nr:CehA/McbA family metallohydrolase [Anaerolineales bacterium]
MLTEITVNLHMHTRYSDGHGAHTDIARAALAAGLDAVIVTDHNIWISGLGGYFREGAGRVLVLIGEEIHDAARDPQKNHLLVFGAQTELAAHAADPQNLIDQVRKAGGLSYLAHPFDQANRTFGEPDITWDAWDARRFTGIELWNGLSEFKSLLKTRLHAVFYAFNPGRVPHGPPPALLSKWDELLASGRRVVAIGGSDAHRLPGRLGPLRRTIFPYRVHFKSINNHLLLPEPLTGIEETDEDLIYAALAAGHSFIGNDQPEKTHGFRFTGQTETGNFLMGDEVTLGAGATLQIRLPHRAACNLLKDGSLYRSWTDRTAMVVNVSEPGVYRVECYLPYKGKRRGWIFSNPVYIR